MSKGWIKLHRSLKDWEWYEDANCVRLLVHLLVSVNYQPKKHKGQFIDAGELWTSVESLSRELNLTPKQIRTSLKKLENSNEISRKRAIKGQVVTLVKWEELQGDDFEVGNQRAIKGQSKGNQRATTKEGKESKEGKEVSSKKTSTNFVKPTIEEVKAYCDSRKNNVDPIKFFNHYEATNWFRGKNKIKNWKACVHTWERNQKTNSNGNSQNTSRSARSVQGERTDYD